jgi:hypothetical protein
MKGYARREVWGETVSLKCVRALLATYGAATYAFAAGKSTDFAGKPNERS